MLLSDFSRDRFNGRKLVDWETKHPGFLLLLGQIRRWIHGKASEIGNQPLSAFSEMNSGLLKPSSRQLTAEHLFFIPCDKESGSTGENQRFIRWTLFAIKEKCSNPWVGAIFRKLRRFVYDVAHAYLQPRSIRFGPPAGGKSSDKWEATQIFPGDSIKFACSTISDRDRVIRLVLVGVEYYAKAGKIDPDVNPDVQIHLLRMKRGQLPNILHEYYAKEQKAQLIGEV